MKVGINWEFSTFHFNWATSKTSLKITVTSKNDYISLFEHLLIQNQTPRLLNIISKCQSQTLSFPLERRERFSCQVVQAFAYKILLNKDLSCLRQFCWPACSTPQPIIFSYLNQMRFRNNWAVDTPGKKKPNKLCLKVRG